MKKIRNRKKKKKNNRSLFIILLILLVGLFFTYKLSLEGLLDLGYKVFIKDKEVKFSTKIEILSDSSNFIIDDYIINFNEESIRFISIDKNTVDKEYSIVDKKIVKGLENVYLVDNFSIIIFNKNGEILDSLNFKNKILFVKEKDRDNLLIVTKLEDGKNRISIYSNKKIEDRLDLNKNIVDGILINKDIVVGEIYIKNNTINSSIARLNNNKQDVWGKEFEDEIITNIEKIGDNYLIDTDRHLYIFNTKENIWKIRKDLFKDYYLDENKIVILLENEISYLNFNGRRIRTIDLTGNYEKMYHYKNEIVLFNDRSIKILERGYEISDFVSESRMDTVYLLEDRLLIKYGKELYLYDIVNKND